LKVLFLQDHLSTGGAARAAGRFASGLQRLGVEVAVSAGDATSGPGLVRVTGKPGRGWGRVRQLLLKKVTQIQEKKFKAELLWKEAIAGIQPDLIWVHNIEGALKWGWSLDMVRIALRAAPVLWTLHDMWALGDGPSYFAEEEIKERWPGSPLNLLQESSGSQNLRVLTPSVWLRDLVRSVGVGSCEVWPNPLDTEIFQPDSRERVRQELGFKGRDTFLLAAAENLEDPRKGIDLLEQAWGQIRGLQGVRLGLIGRNCPPKLQTDPKITKFGPIASEKRMAELMSAADLFIHPAKVESFGLVLEEAQACGTPVLCFSGGGVRETLEEQVTGWILPERSGNELARHLGHILDDKATLLGMRPRCRERIRKRHKQSQFEAHWRNINSVSCIGTRQRTIKI